MTLDIAVRVTEWFSLLTGDGEFELANGGSAFTVVPPASARRPTLITSKACPYLQAAQVIEPSSRPGLFARRGLPSVGDVRWLRKVIGSGRAVFLGDLDTPDLLFFAFLRHCLRPRRIVYLGVSDEYMHELRIAVPRRYRIKATPNERKSLSVLNEVMPDWWDLVGEESFRIVSSGYKIEIEAIVSCLRDISHLLNPIVA